MSLYDVMSHAGLAIYAEVALVLFFAVFVAIVVRTFLPSRRKELEDTARLVLDDDPKSTPERGARA
jgi:cbb3-type cytochrome oxidase subunit 3